MKKIITVLLFVVIQNAYGANVADSKSKVAVISATASTVSVAVKPAAQSAAKSLNAEMTRKDELAEPLLGRGSKLPEPAQEDDGCLACLIDNFCAGN